jgi:hypothetical protein
VVRPRSLFTLVLAAALVAVVAAQERPLPELEPFLREVRRHLEPDDQRQSGYMYAETRHELKLDKSGKSTKETVKVLESYPGLPGEDDRWERLISEDGKPVPADELAKRDREREKKAQDYVRRFMKDPEKVQREEQRERDKERRESAELVDEIFRIYDVRLVRRESLEGHDTIVLALTPRPDAKPRMRDGHIMQKFIVNAWISESDYELARVDIEATDTVSVGFGLLARVHKGTRASFTRRKVSDEIWLPASASYTASVRVALFKVFRVGGTSEFSGYRKFTVGTTTTYVSPQEPH